MASDAATLNPPADSGDCAGDEDEASTLRSLLELSTTEEGRLRLASTGTVPAVLRRLSSSLPNLLLNRLRLLRNLCVTSAGQDAFLESGGPDRVASVLVRTPPITAEIVRVLLQVLGNVSLAGDRHRAAVWARFFPNWFFEIACVRDPLIVDALCMVLDSCLTSSGGRQRVAELCEPGRGLPIVLEIIVTVSHYSRVTDDNKESWLDWLFCKVCVEEQYFPHVFRGLSLTNSMTDGRFTCFSREQACLLQILARYLSDQAKEVNAITDDFALGILEILNQAATIVDFTFGSKSVLPTGNQNVNVLGFSLIILKDTLVWENKHSQPASANSLISAGLLHLVLELLRVLEPPEIVRKTLKDASGEAIPQSVAGKVCPYRGYRSDVVAVIANCLYKRKEVQDEIRKQNGIPLLLQQCVIDDNNPYLKEWAVMSIRNLLEGNVENQSEVAELELKEPVMTPQMAGTGLKIEIDKDTRRPKLVNI